MNTNNTLMVLVAVVFLACKPKENAVQSGPKVPLTSDLEIKAQFNTDRMAWVPPGSFEMGSEMNQDEQPVHLV